MNPSPPQIRVLIVDDSAFMRTALSRLLDGDHDLRVVGTAASGAEALLRIKALNPDVITLDVQMPGLNGLQTLRRIMVQFPRPVIMVSSLTLQDAEITFDALAAGAFDYVPKQLASDSLDIFHIRGELIAKIKAAAESCRSHALLTSLRKPPRTADQPRRQLSPFTPAVIALGTSTGGPHALQEIFSALPADLPVPILVVQHMPPAFPFTAAFAERLNSLCPLSVSHASQGELLRPGVAYLAPAGSHMSVIHSPDSCNAIHLEEKSATDQYAPSVEHPDAVGGLCVSFPRHGNHPHRHGIGRR